MEENALIIGSETVRKHLSVQDVIDTVEKTWKWYGEGRIIMPPKITTDMSSAGVDGWFNTMPCYIAPLNTAGMKIVGGFAGNHALGLPYIKASLVLISPETGLLRAVINGDWISDMRTGAQPAIMARLLAAKTDIITIIGAGQQGYTSLLCMSKVLDIKEVRICDISKKAIETFMSRFVDFPFKVVPFENRETACRGSDIIITATTANDTLVKDAWVDPGTLVMTMGSFRETDYDLIRNADLLAVDHPEQALHRGNFKELGESGELTIESFDIVVPYMLAGKSRQGRRKGTDRICAQLVGMGCLDVAVASLLYNRILESGDEVLKADMRK